MDGEDPKMVCPLLASPDTYKPDTIDLETNEAERNYWLPCLETMIKKFVSKAGALNPNNSAATEKAEECFQRFRSLVKKAARDPKALSPLSIRTLLEFHEENLRRSNFKDAWRTQKETESSAALAEFKSRIDSIDGINNYEERWLEIVTGVLAGNVFDWGSAVVADILETSTEFGFSHAMETIEKRPWFVDDFDSWMQRLKAGPYKEAVIFVDNAGVDLVLGVLPMVRQLLIEGTKVVLTANTSPSLNDVTARELELYVREAARYCPAVLETALQCGQLVCVENGQSGPCLDLSRLSPELCRLMTTADLVIIEGMARAVHTNLYAEFKTDSVKMAVLKNEWLAKSLGGKQFSVIFKYEKAATKS